MSEQRVELRLLAARSELGYVNRPDRAMPDEPEAITAQEQQELTRRSHAAKADRDRAVVRAACAVITVELETLEEARVTPDVSSDLRAIRRTLERLRLRVLTAA